jgi:CRISPR-associated protein Csx17
MVTLSGEVQGQNILLQPSLMQTQLTTAPLSSYLSALGLLKVLNAQLDPEGRGFWQDGFFCLETERTHEEISHFLAADYTPSPCITPWNKPKRGKGFLGGEVPAEIINLKGERFAELQRVAKAAAPVIQKYAQSGKVPLEEKGRVAEQLSRDSKSDAFSAWLGVCIVTGVNAKGAALVRFPALLGGSGGFIGKDFGSQFVASLTAAKVEHFNAAIFGSSNPNVLHKDGNSLTYNPGGRGDGQQGYRVAIKDTQPTVANPAELILLAEGMNFFNGYATTTHEDEQSQGGIKQASFTLAVMHNSSGHSSTSWLENKGQLPEELWCPLWEEPVTFRELRDELARVAMLPLPRQLRTGTDFALFASQLGRTHGLSGFARYCFPPRVGKGTKIPSLIEVVQLADGKEDRTDALAAVAAFAWRLRMRGKDPATPTSYRCAAEQVVAELEVLSSGSGSFASLLRQLVAWRLQEELLKPDQQSPQFRFRRRELPPLWFELLARELDGPEWRLALALATGRPYASTRDVLLLLEGRLDEDLVSDLEMGIAWIERRGLRRLPSPEVQLPWLPPDYLAGLLLNQWSFANHVPVAGDLSRWRELLLAGRPDEAMAVALHRLRIAEVVSWPWPAITHSDPQRLLKAVQVAIHPLILQRMQKG